MNKSGRPKHKAWKELGFTFEKEEGNCGICIMETALLWDWRAEMASVSKH